MKSFRLALPIAALAALASATCASALDIASAQQFMIEENNRAQAQAEENSQPANEPAAAEESEQQAKTKKNANPWSDIRTASLVPAPNTPATSAAPAANADNAPVFALIEKHAAANGIPAAFARAVVRIESNFNPRATGRHREVGLMQIKYETARGIGFTGTREQLYDPDTNLQWGMKYLAMAWKLGGATPCGAVLRYQAGHAATQPTAASRVYCSKVQAHMESAN